MSNKKDSLLIVTDYFYPHWTGISKSLGGLVEAIDNLFDITILTVRHRKDLKQNDTFGRAKILRENYLFIISRSCYSVAIVIKFLFIVHKFDTVFINSPSANMLPFSLIAKLFGKRLIVFNQGDLILPEGIINKIIGFIFRISAYVSCLLADTVSTYSLDYAKNSYVLKPYLRKCRTFLMPPDEAFITQGTKGKNRKSSVIKFGFAGRFVEEKGFDILFEAIPQIKKTLPQARFLFAGEAHMTYENFFEKKKYLLDKVRDDIQFLGLLDNKKMLHFYKDIDFIIVPSRSDAHNMVQTEAMLCGTPSIAADIPGLRFLPKETGFGVLFKKEDASDLTVKTINAVRQKNDILRKYKFVKEQFDKTKNVETIKNIFKN